MVVGLVVTGEGLVADAFRRLAALVGDQSEPLEEWQSSVEGDAGQLVPVDTGALAATLTGRTSADRAYVEAGAGLNYAHLVEPFLKDAASTHDPDLDGRVDDSIDSMIRRVGLA